MTRFRLSSIRARPIMHVYNNDSGVWCDKNMCDDREDGLRVPHSKNATFEKMVLEYEQDCWIRRTVRRYSAWRSMKQGFEVTR